MVNSLEFGFFVIKYVIPFYVIYVPPVLDVDVETVLLDCTVLLLVEDILPLPLVEILLLV